LQSRIFLNPALRSIATAGFPEILAGKSFGLPFLRKFWLCKPTDCLFYGKSGSANLAHACIFFPEAFRIIAKRFTGVKHDDDHSPRTEKPLTSLRIML